ncbi:hypothetical protein MTO96_044336, partial [Rhipicephalus appendiculatus]
FAYALGNVQLFTGGVVYLELKGDHTNALLTSPNLTGRDGFQCLGFRYRIPRNYGDKQTMYALSVFVQGSEEILRTWSTGELQRSSWTAIQVSFKEEKDFKVIIQCSMNGRSLPTSYCAIDAIKLRDCQGKPAHGDSLCDFEDGWCSWRSRPSPSASVSWMLGGGNVKTSLSRPPKDHTNYEQNIGDKGDLISEFLSSSSKITQCVEFWYIISGDKTELKVLTRSPTQNEHGHLPLWTQESGASSEWQLGRIAVPHRNQVIFRATVGAAATPAFVALDDIAIVHHDRCETFPKGSEAFSASK